MVITCNVMKTLIAGTNGTGKIFDAEITSILLMAANQNDKLPCPVIR